MSTTYDIACHDCKVVLWIGQGDRIYCTAEHLEKQRDFFYNHKGHHLEFNNGEVFSALYDFKSLDGLDGDEDEGGTMTVLEQMAKEVGSNSYCSECGGDDAFKGGKIWGESRKTNC